MITEPDNEGPGEGTSGPSPEAEPEPEIAADPSESEDAVEYRARGACPVLSRRLHDFIIEQIKAGSYRNRRRARRRDRHLHLLPLARQGKRRAEADARQERPRRLGEAGAEALRRFLSRRRSRRGRLRTRLHHHHPQRRRLQLVGRRLAPRAQVPRALHHWARPQDPGRGGAGGVPRQAREAAAPRGLRCRPPRRDRSQA